MPTLDQPWPRTHHELVQYYYDQYDEGIRAGRFQPFLYPWGTLGALVVIIYLLIPHQSRPWLRNARFVAFAWIAGFAAYTIKYTRARGMAPALGLGLVSAWSVIWIMAIIVVNDAQTDFQRIERTEGVFRATAKGKDSQNGSANFSSAMEKESNGSLNGSISNGRVEVHEQLGPSKRHGEFAWQPYPITPFIERLDWVLDIFCNFRGAGWNWRPSNLPPLPKWVQEQLIKNSAKHPSQSTRTHPGQAHVYETRREVLLANLKTLTAGYLILDGLKTLMMHDPYFWGVMDRSPPSYFPLLLTSMPTLVKAYRLTASMYAVKWAMQSIFCLAPLFFSGVLGPSILGARAEPWIYPETWGPFSVVLERGLAGWWASWWHQTFRFAFEEPSRKIVQLTGMNPKAPMSKLLQLTIAFGLSGFLHASGSYTSVGSSRPIRGPMRFFLIQALGIFLEAILTQSLRKTGIQRRVPQWFMHMFTFVYVHFWFYHTGPLLCDDFAKAGVWLFEPVPVSLFRALGLGVEGDSWWCWSGNILRWHRGDRWWSSGIAF